MFLPEPRSPKPNRKITAPPTLERRGRGSSQHKAPAGKPTAHNNTNQVGALVFPRLLYELGRQLGKHDL